ncbi:hypothetical protein FRX31_018542, partial [Thalictrum thalictroides]
MDIGDVAKKLEKKQELKVERYVDAYFLHGMATKFLVPRSHHNAAALIVVATLASKILACITVTRVLFVSSG